METTETSPATCKTCGREIDAWGFGIPLEQALEHEHAAVRRRAELKRDLDRYHAMRPGEKIRLAMAILWDVCEYFEDDHLTHYPDDMPSFDEYLARLGSQLYDITWDHHDAR